MGLNGRGQGGSLHPPSYLSQRDRHLKDCCHIYHGECLTWTRHHHHHTHERTGLHPTAAHDGQLTPMHTRAYAYTLCIELLRTAPPPTPPSQRLRVREARRAASAGWVLQGTVMNQDSKGLKTC